MKTKKTNKQVYKRLNPGFNYKEAKDMIGLAFTADILAPTGVGKAWRMFGTTQIPPSDNPLNPIPPEIEEWIAYPDNSIWPAGWAPALLSDDGTPWGGSVLTSTLPGLYPGTQRLKSNFVLFAYNEALDAYCVAFAGTTNLPTTMQDVLYTPVCANETTILPNSDVFGYCSGTSYVKVWEQEEVIIKDDPNVNPQQPPIYQQPARVEPTVSTGIRFGLESLTIRADEEGSLISMIRKTGRTKMNLFITGHSLGAGMASLFAAWLQAGNMQGIDFSIKTYAYGPEKLGNEVFINNFNIGLTNQGYHFVVKNTLDIAPQLPLNEGEQTDLINPKGTLTWLPFLTQEVLAEQAIFLGRVRPSVPILNSNYNFFHPGFPITLKANYPVIFIGQYYPEIFYQGKGPIPIKSKGMDDFSVTFLRIWWHHMPWNYRLYLDQTFGESPKKMDTTSESDIKEETYKVKKIRTRPK